MRIKFVSADKCYTTVWNDYIDESWQEVLEMGTWKQILGKPARVNLKKNGECSRVSIKFRGERCD